MKPYARAGRTARREVGRMNKTEADYAAYLDLLVKAGAIASWKFEALKLRLADRCFYDTDFMVVRSDGTLEMHEVKGFMEDDARVKLSVAAEQFPFCFLLVRREGKTGWKIEEV